MNRRRFLANLGLAAGLVPLAREAVATSDPARSGEGPFSGDEPSAIHKYLRDGRAIETPPPSGSYDVIVVGGGISGIAATYRLRGMNVLLLEKDRLLGGVSKMERWNGIDYPIGAAYMAAADEGTELDRLYKELGLDREWRRTNEEEEALFADGKMELGFWNRTPEFRRARDFFKNMLEKGYPGIPYTRDGAYTRDQYASMDRVSFADWLAKGMGESRRSFPALIVNVIDCYIRAAFCAPLTQVSAWAGLNFFLADMGASCVLPGGNARVVEKMVATIRAVRPECLVTGRPVLKVKPNGKRWHVTLGQARGKFTTYAARAIVMACPKFTAARIVEGLPPEQLAAIREIKVRAYLVVNGLFRRPLVPKVYGGYTLPGDAYTDIGVAEWASGKPTKNSVLTLYKPFLDDSSRSKLLRNDLHPSWQAEARRAFAGILSGLGFRPDDLVDVRLARWGHAIPFPRPGQLSAGVFEKAAQPGKGLFFCGQDAEGVPCIESAIGSAIEAADAVKKYLG